MKKSLIIVGVIFSVLVVVAVVRSGGIIESVPSSEGEAVVSTSVSSPAKSAYVPTQARAISVHPTARTTTVAPKLVVPTPVPYIGPYGYEVLKFSKSTNLTKAKARDPNNMLGAPDGIYFSIQGGDKETDVKIRGLRNGPGFDLLVVEIGNPDEPYDVLVWDTNRNSFVYIGEGLRGSAQIDLAASGVEQTDIVRLVGRGSSRGQTPGADIDALVAMQSVSPGYSPFVQTPTTTIAVPAMSGSVVSQTPVIITPEATPIPKVQGVGRNQLVLVKQFTPENLILTPGGSKTEGEYFVGGGCGCPVDFDVSFKPKRGDIKVEIRRDEPEGPVGDKFQIPDQGIFVYAILWAPATASEVFVEEFTLTMKQGGKAVDSVSIFGFQIPALLSLTSSIKHFKLKEDENHVSVTAVVENGGDGAQGIWNLRVKNCNFPTEGAIRFLENNKTIDPKKKMRIERKHARVFEVEIGVPEELTQAQIKVEMECEFFFSKGNAPAV